MRNSEEKFLNELTNSVDSNNDFDELKTNINYEKYQKRVKRFNVNLKFAITSFAVAVVVVFGIFLLPNLGKNNQKQDEVLEDGNQPTQSIPNNPTFPEDAQTPVEDVTPLPTVPYEPEEPIPGGGIEGDDGCFETPVIPNEPTETPRLFTICVNFEAEEYYQQVINTYIEENNLDVIIEVCGVDIGSYYNTVINNPEYGADIFMASHNSLGYLLAETDLIAPYTDSRIVNQILTNTTNAVQEVCYVNGDYYGVPVQRDCLVLYYDKRYFADDEAVSSWEKILEVAESNNKKAVSYMGSDPSYYSHWLLAQPESSDAISTFGNSGTLQLFKNGIASNNMAWGDDQIAIHSYAKRFTLNQSGRNGDIVGMGKIEFENGDAITFIGGRASYKTMKGLLKDNLGFAVLPTFTLTSEDEYGSAKAGMQFQSGTFEIDKCFIKKNNSLYEEYLDDIIYYLSSDEVQSGLYENTGILPASINIEIPQIDDFGYAQSQQIKTSSIVSPFSYDKNYNIAYQFKGGPQMFVEIHQNTDGLYSNKENIKFALQKISYIWANNAKPTSDEEVINWVNR